MDLSKGQNGDWQKEGYTLHHRLAPGNESIITAKDPHGNVAGWYNIGNPEGAQHLYVSESETYPDHQRKGLATAAYQMAEKIHGKKIASEHLQSHDAKKFWNQPNRPFGKSEIELWHDDRIKHKPSAMDLIKGQQGDWKKEGYKVGIEHESTWQPKKGSTEYHVVAHSPAGKEVGRYTFHHHPDRGLRVSTADTDSLHQRKGLASEAYRLIQRHTGLQVQPDAIQSDEAKALWNQPNRPFGKSEDNIMSLEHYSSKPGLETVNPEYHGTGVKGEESKRKANPDWVDRSYHYIAGSQPEPQLGAQPYKYNSQVPAKHIYDYQKDPANLKQKSMWGTTVDKNLYEKNIKEAGYHGYINHGSPGMGSVVAIFHPVKVNQIQKSEKLSKAIDKDEFSKTIDTGHAITGKQVVDHTPHMKIEPDHAQYIHDLQHPDKQMPSGMYDEGISPKMVHKMPYGTFMVKPFHEDNYETSGLATMTAKNLYNAAGIGHLNENVSATHIEHPENPSHKVPVIVSKFNPNAVHINSSSISSIDPKEAGQVNVMDYLMGNDDRHSHNSMVQLDTKNKDYKMSPLAIDHGFSFTYGGHNSALGDIIRNSSAIDGMGRAAENMTDKHKEELANWYKQHGDKIHEAMMHSTNSIKDESLQEHIRNNFNKRHKAMQEWSETLNPSEDEWDGIEAGYDDEQPNLIHNRMTDFDIKGGDNIHQLKQLYDKHNPMKQDKDVFVICAAKKLHDVGSDKLVDYFNQPKTNEDQGEFRNLLLHGLVTGYDKHPEHNRLITTLLAKNKQHPDHAKPIYPFVEKLMERQLHHFNRQVKHNVEIKKPIQEKK